MKYELESERQGPARVLVAGGGVAALEAALALTNLAPDRAELELVSPQRDFVYRSLAVAAPFGGTQVARYDLDAIARGIGARYRCDAVVGVDARGRTARTRAGATLRYDALIVAHGAVPRPALPGALTFWGPEEASALREVVLRLERGDAGRIAFTLPASEAWSLPLYELAVLTSDRLAHVGARVRIIVVTPERAPMEIFGERAAGAIGAMLADRGIELVMDSRPVASVAGSLTVSTRGRERVIEADHVVALPRLVGREVPGLPADADGYLPTDEHGRVPGVDGVYAAGDATSFPVKQGGLAAQQADAVAEHLAAGLGAALEPTPFRPVLRGLLITGGGFSAAAGGNRSTEVATRALWWPPGKIAGRYLGPHLAAKSRAAVEPLPPAGEALTIDVPLDARGVAA